MLRSRSHIAPLLRWLCAFLALVGVAFAYVERVFPDTHDGDPGIVSVYAPVPHADMNRGDVEHGAPLPEPASQHGPHVDHCAHAHAVAWDAPAAVATAPAAAHERFDTVSRRPASVSLPLHRRPPIA